MVDSHGRANLIDAHLHSDGGSEAFTSVDSLVTKFLLNSEDLVELGQTLRSCWCASLDLTSSETNNDIRDGNIFGLTRAVRNHYTPTSSEGVLGGLDGLGESTDLVDLEEESVAGLQLNSLLDTDGVGDR
jgi:hypothetical protein